jgi:hypothetical protein
VIWILNPISKWSHQLTSSVTDNSSTDSPCHTIILIRVRSSHKSDHNTISKTVTKFLTSMETEIKLLLSLMMTMKSPDWLMKTLLLPLTLKSAIRNGFNQDLVIRKASISNVMRKLTLYYLKQKKFKKSPKISTNQYMHPQKNKK